MVVVGYGYWSPNIIRNIQKFPDFNIAAICEKDKSRHPAIKEKYPEINIYKHYEEAFKDPNIDAVVICAVVSAHFRIAKSALEHSKHVLIEKPMAMKVKECEKLIKIAQRNNLIIMIDHTYIYSSMIQKLREIIKSGELGDIYLVDSLRLNFSPIQKDINVVWDLAPHDFSIMNFLINQEPTHVLATGCKPIVHPLQGDGFESVAYINVYSGKKLTGHFYISWLSPVKVRRLMVIGSKKTAIYDQLDPESKIKIYNKGVNIKDTKQISFEYINGPTEKVDIQEEKEDLEFMIKDFLNSIRTGNPPLSDGRLGLDVVKFLCATQKSLEKGGKKIRI